jgi:hypothetical protein
MTPHVLQPPLATTDSPDIYQRFDQIQILQRFT